MKTLLQELVQVNPQVAIVEKVAILETTWMVMKVPALRPKDGRNMMSQKIYIEKTVTMRSTRTN